MRGYIVIASLLASVAVAAPWRQHATLSQSRQTTHVLNQALSGLPLYDESAIDELLTQFTAAHVLAPTNAEPLLARALVLRALVAQCNARCAAAPANRRRLEQAIDAVHQFFQERPADPRVLSLLESCAIMHTKLVSESHLLLSAAHYEFLLTRTEHPSDTLIGNLAEDYMMMGRLGDANALYRKLGGAPRTSSTYGYAVALDRDGQRSYARALIAGLGRRAFDDFVAQIERGDVFFVPEGEVYYYLALAAEALGEPVVAQANYVRFLKSGAHPRFHARAQENLAALRASR